MSNHRRDRDARTNALAHAGRDNGRMAHREPTVTLNAAALALVEEFKDVLNDIAGVHHTALMGVTKVREFFVPLLADAPDPDLDLIIGHGDPNEADTLGYQRWRIGDVAERLAEDGPVARDLGMQWAVMVAAQWESYRQKIADVQGVERNVITDQLMADVAYMRNDVVHHRGIATKQNCGRCKVLRWFEPGDAIVITTERVAEFMHALGMGIRTMSDDELARRAEEIDRASDEPSQ